MTVFVAGALLWPAATFAHPAAACITSITDHCETWYDHSALERGFCISSLVPACATHQHSPSSASDLTQLSADLNDAAAEFRQLRERIVTLQVRRQVLIDAQTQAEQTYRPHSEAPNKLVLTWVARPGAEGRHLVKLTRCGNGSCQDEDFSKFKISSGLGDQTQAAEVEVCRPKNPWVDRCDVYDCEEAHVGMWSVCTFRYTFNKDCMTETCGPL